MNPAIFIDIVCAFWLMLCVYLDFVALLACIGSPIAGGGGWIFLLIILGSLFLWRVRAEDKLMEQL
jgi:hypothetical protein